MCRQFFLINDDPNEDVAQEHGDLGKRDDSPCAVEVPVVGGSCGGGGISGGAGGAGGGVGSGVGGGGGAGGAGMETLGGGLGGFGGVEAVPATGQATERGSGAEGERKNGEIRSREHKTSATRRQGGRITGRKKELIVAAQTTCRS